jgi:hypothetical protein
MFILKPGLSPCCLYSRDAGEIGRQAYYRECIEEISSTLKPTGLPDSSIENAFWNMITGIKNANDYRILI